MPFRWARGAKLWRSYPWRILLLAVAWLVVISMLHYTINVETDQRQVIQMGYMPVITNLAAPILDYASSKFYSEYRFKAIKFASFAEMAEALRNEEIQAAFIIAPLAIVLRQQGEDVKVVYIGNRHESTMVARKSLQAKGLNDLAGSTIAVPMRYSGHNLGALKMITESGLQDKIKLVEMNPPDMAAALAAGALDAYFVGEPFAAQTLKSGDADRIFYVEEVWPNFICNLLLVKEPFILKNKTATQALVHGAIRAGIWAKQHTDLAAEIASDYWGQPQELVKYALTTPEDRIVFDRFMPIQEELQHMANLMVQFELAEDHTVEGLVEDQFAKTVDLSGITGADTILAAP